MNVALREIRRSEVAEKRSIGVPVFLFLLSLAAGLPDILHGFWRFDDGGHLMWALQHHLLAYFFDPEVTRKVVMGQLTPWNTFFYDLNVSLFGLRPGWMYLHLHLISSICIVLLFSLFVMLGCSVGSSALLSVLFLFSPPWYEASHNLMTAHYVYGMLFMQSAFILFLKGMEEGRGSTKYIFFILSSLFYAFSLTCKEVYVLSPILLIGIIIFRFNRNGTFTLKQIVFPFFLWLLFFGAYFKWRHYILASLVGNYLKGGSPAGAYSAFETLLNGLIKIIGLPFFGPWWINLIFFILLGLMIASFDIRKRPSCKLALICFFSSTFSVVIYIGYAIAHAPYDLPPRYGIMAVWASVLAFAIYFNRLRAQSFTRTVSVFFILAFFCSSVYCDLHTLQSRFKESESYYAFAVSPGGSGDILFLPKMTNYPSQLWAIRQVYSGTGYQMPEKHWKEMENPACPARTEENFSFWIWSSSLSRLIKC